MLGMFQLEQSIRTPWELLVADVQIWVSWRIVVVGVALGEIVGGEDRAEDDPGIGYLLPFGGLVGVVVVSGGGEALLVEERVRSSAEG